MLNPPSGITFPILILQIILWTITLVALIATVDSFIKKKSDLTLSVMITIILAFAGLIATFGATASVFTINFYGIILMLGAVAGGWLASIEVRRRGQDPEIVWDLLVYLIIGGVIGARLWHILTPAPSSIAQGFTTYYYFTHPLDAIDIRKGGLGIPGTIMGGLIALYIFTRNYKKITFVEWTDIAAPALALGQAIGRFGNFFNQELYGAPTNLPWKIYIDPAHRLAGFENEAYYHPLFAYESLLDFANMLFLLWLTRQYSGKLKKGDVFNVYLIAYPVIRFFLDFLRLDASRILSININQTLSAVVAVVAAGALIWRHRSQFGGSAQSKTPRSVEATQTKPAAESAAIRSSRISGASKVGKAPLEKTPTTTAATGKRSLKKTPRKKKAARPAKPPLKGRTK
jgi:phosphatidylglycerol---prolipoprotein diacylglyceryl transferase